MPRVIGVDCATKASRVGLATAEVDGDSVVVTGVTTGAEADVIQTLVSSLAIDEPVLLALDAPLGWPRPLADGLADHVAGAVVRGRPDDLFLRATDLHVLAHYGKRPLEVGADRIARTAVAALTLLDDLRRETGHAIPLAWAPGPPQEDAAIEVYPAATLAARGLLGRGYKKDADDRLEMVSRLATHVHVPPSLVPMLKASEDALDAVVCCLAAADFVRGDVVAPHDEETARREGWMWVKAPPA